MDTVDKIIIVISFAAWGIYAIAACNNQITLSEAKPKLERVLNMKKSDFTVIEETNNQLIFGNPFDVTYNIQIKSTKEVVSCRCTDGIFQPLICRKYQ